MSTSSIPAATLSPASVASPLTSNTPHHLHASSASPHEPSPSPLRKSWDGIDRRQATALVATDTKKRSSHRIASDGFDSIKAFMTKRSKKRQGSGFLLQTFERPSLDGHASNPQSEESHRNSLFKEQQRTAEIGQLLPGPGTVNGVPVDHPTEVRSFQGPISRSSSDLYGRASRESSDRGAYVYNAASTSSKQSDRSSSLPFVAEESNGLHHTMRGSAPMSDPADLVRMALTLNESRKLHLGPGRLASPTSSSSRRAASMGGIVSPGLPSPKGTMRGASHEIPRSSSGKFTMDRPSIDSEAPFGQSGVFSDKLYLDHDYNFSPATLERAERARTTLELSYEYRRLLQSLPPLRPSALSRVSTASSAQADDDQGHVLRDRHSQRELGRPFNPLQYIRNKKVRARERQTLDAEADGWRNVAVVDTWIAVVEVDASHEGFLQDDVVLLPSWDHHSHGHLLGAPIHADAVVPNKKNRSKLDWVIDPADLLADAYWLEQDNNKTLIEKGSGAKVFDRFRRPKALAFGGRSRRNSLYHGNSASMDITSPNSRGGVRSPASTGSSDSDTESYTEIVESLSPVHESRASRIKRKILRRSRADSHASTISSSDDDGRRKSVFQHKRSPTGENVGPLTIHMNKIMEEQSRNQSRLSVEEQELDPQDDLQRRMAMSNESPMEVKLPSNRHSLRTGRDTGSTTHTDTPRISIDDFDTVQRTATNNMLETIPSGGSQETEPARKPRAHGLNFFKWQKDKHHIAENDFAVVGPTEEPLSPILSHSPERLSLESLRRSESYTSLRSLGTSRRPSRSKSTELMYDNHEGKTPRRRKGGRVDELVREEIPFASETSTSSRNGSITSVHSRKGSGDSNAPERRRSSVDMLQPNSKNSHSISPGKQGKRSRSRDDRYHVQPLPTFVSSRSPERRTSRLQITTMPKTSPSKASRASSSDRYPYPPLRQDSGHLEERARSASRSGSHSRANSVNAAANRRLDRLLSSPGGVLLGESLVTGLAGLAKGNEQHENPSANNHGQWSLANNNEGLPKEAQHNSPITRRDIASVRTLLLASGIKANTLVRRADEIPSEPSPFLAAAARTVNASVAPISRRQEHVVAAQLLSAHLENTVSSFESMAGHFRDNTCARLEARLDELREKVASQLIPQVRSIGDEADAFVAHLTTTNTLAIKQVNDHIDQIIRNRRRRLRWLRGTGFALLEYVLVGIMWWIWLFVFILQAVKTVIVGGVRAVRWLVWF